MREVPVDWEALEDAFENNAPEVHSYLHTETGDVLRVVDGIADPLMHNRIASDNSYLRIEPVSSREQYRWMERFIEVVTDENLIEALTAAIDGKGAFRRFKDVLMSHSTERETWFHFRSEKLRVFIDAWLEAHQVTSVERKEWIEPAEPSESSSTPPVEGRSLESVRRALHEIVDTLSMRDLDHFQAYGEFLSHRRARRRSNSES